MCASSLGLAGVVVLLPVPILPSSSRPPVHRRPRRRPRLVREVLRRVRHGRGRTVPLDLEWKWTDGDGDQKLANVVATETFFHGGKLNCLCRGRRWGRLSYFGVFNGMYHARIMFSFTCFCFRDEIPIYHGSFVPSPSMEYASRVSPTSIMHACITLTTAAECRLTHLVWFCGIIFKTLL